MAVLRRLVRLWRVYAYLDFLFVTKDIRRFLIFLVSDGALAVAFLSAMLLLAERFDGIGPWSKYQIAFMLGYGQIMAGLLVATFFGYNLTHISRRIGRGQLDHSLIQPHSLFMTFVTEGFTPWSGIGFVAPGLVLMGWAAWSLRLEPSAGWLALLGAQVLGSGAVAMSFHFIWGTLAFWAPRGAEEVSTETHRLFDHLRPFPLDGVGIPGQAALLTAVPVGFLGWYPSRALLGIDSSVFALAITPAAGALFLAAAAFVFRRGLAHYGDTGSSRYSAFGHRR